MSLIVSHLHKKYGEKTVVDDLSFAMEKPGVYALLGTNGAGKTTTIRMMLGMLARDGGEVLWNGKPLSTETVNVGYLAEERGLYPKYSLMDQLTYFASLRGVPASEAKERIRGWAKKVGRRRVSLCRRCGGHGPSGCSKGCPSGEIQTSEGCGV